MEAQEVKQLLMQELPAIMQEDPEIRQFILRLSRQHFADREETESRFERLLDELRQQREEESRRWAEQDRRWAEQQQELSQRWAEQARQWEEQDRRWAEQQQELSQRWAEQARQWEEQNRRWAEQERRWAEQQQELSRRWAEQARQWEEQNRRWAEQARQWEEQNRRWAEQDRKWQENQAAIQSLLQEVRALARKHDSTLGALGARWGLYTEQSFRQALKGILEDSFAVRVVQFSEFDEQGEVFGRPDQVELDLIIRDGVLILCEIKSSMSKSDMYVFERKARFYEKRHGQQAARLLVISPMVDRWALEVARRLGIEVYSYAEDVDPALFAGGAA